MLESLATGRPGAAATLDRPPHRQRSAQRTGSRTPPGLRRDDPRHPRLSLLHTPKTHSRFLNEAGYATEPATLWALPDTPTAGTGYWNTPRTPITARPAVAPAATPVHPQREQDLKRLGVLYALRTAPTRAQALDFAHALITSPHLLLHAKTGANLTLAGLAEALDEATPADRRAIRSAASTLHVTNQRVAALNTAQRQALARVIDQRRTTSP